VRPSIAVAVLSVVSVVSVVVVAHVVFVFTVIVIIITMKVHATRVVPTHRIGRPRRARVIVTVPRIGHRSPPRVSLGVTV
jgi:hypothetical protein